MEAGLVVIVKQEIRGLADASMYSIYSAKKCRALFHILTALRITLVLVVFTSSRIDIVKARLTKRIKING